MKRTAIISKEILSVGYDAETQVLEIEFNDKSVYQFVRVTAEVYASFMRTEAKQEYFDTEIRDKYANQCVSL